MSVCRITVSVKNTKGAIESSKLLGLCSSFFVRSEISWAFRRFCFYEPNRNIFVSKIDFMCSTAGFSGVAARRHAKITQMTIKPSKMLGFHFLKKENDRKAKPDPMSDRNCRVKSTFMGKKIDFV